MSASAVCFLFCARQDFECMLIGEGTVDPRYWAHDSAAGVRVFVGWSQMIEFLVVKA